MIRAAILSAAAAGVLGGCAGLAGNRLPELTKLIARTSPAVVAVGDEKNLLGSGFRLEHSQLIVTAAHVVNDLKGATRIVWNSRTLAAHVKTVDVEHDVALLELDGEAPMPGLTLASAAPPPAPGEWVVVLGCPFGAGPTATTGIISAVPGAVLEPARLQRLIQLNAAVNPGNSGGPVLNLRGEVVGIANATIPGGFGLGFAVPVGGVRAVIDAAAVKP